MKKEDLEHLVGQSVKLVKMDDPYTSLKAGDAGTVRFIDDICNIHVDWDNGSTLALILGVDVWEVVTNKIQ